MSEKIEKLDFAEIHARLSGMEISAAIQSLAEILVDKVNEMVEDHNERTK